MERQGGRGGGRTGERGRGGREMKREERYKLLKAVIQRGRPGFLQQRRNLSWHQLGLLQPRCPIDFYSAAMWRQPIMADWLGIDWIVTWNSDLFFLWASACVCVCKGREWGRCAGLWDVGADEGRCTGSISITVSASPAPIGWLPQYTSVSDLEAVLSKTLLLSQHPRIPAACAAVTRSLYFPGVHKAMEATN